MARHVAEKSDVEARIVERAELGREIATERYFGGLLFPPIAGCTRRNTIAG